MIKANELRIGNYVINNKGRLSIIKDISEGMNGTVRVVDTEHYDSDVLWGLGCSEINGMPLTPYILLRCGFSETISNRDSGYKQIGKIVNGHDFMFTIECNHIPEFYFDMVGTEIIYLHQLQNLYFALTGIELDFKP